MVGQEGRQGWWEVGLKIKLKLSMGYSLGVVTKSFVLGTCLQSGRAESKELQNSCSSVILPVNTVTVDCVSPEEVSAE